MRDATYLREQAKLCLEIADQMSDRKIAEGLQAEAARYHAEAAGVETSERRELQHAPDLRSQPGRGPI
jgi:hypothetical protein